MGRARWPAGVRITDEPDATEADCEAVLRGLRAFNEPLIGRAGHAPLNLFVRDATEVVVGGLVGEYHWHWLFVDLLWVSDTLRGLGIGTALMQTAEDAARARGCVGLYLDTLEFQARPFYERMGLEVFGVLEDYPPGHTRYFMRKRF